jgi:hypothetical protein
MTTTKTAKLSFKSFGAKDEQPKEVPFVTSRGGPVRKSRKHTILSGTLDDLTREIRIYDESSRIHRCKVDRLPSTEAARALWKKLVEAQKKEQEIRFLAAGGNNPELWFYDIEVAE